jgi:exopolysaccharide production protein ExoQ
MLVRTAVPGPGKLERRVVILLLAWFTGGLIPFIVNADAFSRPSVLPRDMDPVELLSDTDREFLRQFWLPAYLLIIGLIVPRAQFVLRTIFCDRLLLMLVALPVCSIGWSVATEDTKRRIIALLISTLFGYYLGMRFSLGEGLRLLAKAMSVVTLLSLLMIVFWPALGTMTEIFDNAWRGIFTHKNTLGQMMLLNIIVIAIILPDLPKRRWMAGVALVLSCIILWFSFSRTPLLIGFVLLFVLLMLRCLRLEQVKSAAAIASLCALAAAVILFILGNVGAFLGAFGKDTTLTGRTDLWHLVWALIQERFLLGYGYQAVWTDWSSPTARIWIALGWAAPSAHNGFLEIWLTLGVVGLVLALASIISTFTTALIRLLRFKNKGNDWTIIFVLLVFFYSFTESRILIQNDIIWVLYVATLVWHSGVHRTAPVPSMMEQLARVRSMRGQPMWGELTKVQFDLAHPEPSIRSRDLRHNLRNSADQGA